MVGGFLFSVIRTTLFSYSPQELLQCSSRIQFSQKKCGVDGKVSHAGKYPIALLSFFGFFWGVEQKELKREILLGELEKFDFLLTFTGFDSKKKKK